MYIFELTKIMLQLLLPPRRANERGLSQSTENAILLVGAAAIAIIIVAAVNEYVSEQLGKL